MRLAAVFSAFLATSSATFIAIQDAAGVTTPLSSIHVSETGEAQLRPVSDLTSLPHEACAGVIDSHNKFTCHSLFNFKDSESIGFKVFVDEDGDVLHVNAVPHKSGVEVVKPKDIPAPSLKSSSKKSQKANEFTTGANDDANAEEEEKSFFQKYWYYIVPLGLVLIVNSGNAQPQQG